jgi:beta-galactosidase
MASSDPPTKSSRRSFLSQSTALAAATLPLPIGNQPSAGVDPCPTESIGLTGDWLFRTDPHSTGESSNWFASEYTDPTDWRTVRLPHTWQVDPDFVDYRGLAWYRGIFDAAPRWQRSTVRIEFQAVYHSAKVWINGHIAGEHLRKPYTAFSLDITHLLRFDRPNSVAVLVDSSIDQHMLPRGRSSDWALDGGIYRPVQLLITPKIFLERADIDAIPVLPSGPANLDITFFARNTSALPFQGGISLLVSEEASNRLVLDLPNHTQISIPANSHSTAHVSASLSDPKLWHFDHPHLYRLEAVISDQHNSPHAFSSTFGIRKIEIKDTAFYLNGQRVKLAGVERMGGSHPEFGMAETSEWIAHDHADLKNLNCVFTRVHWPQDSRVLDYCDRHGILIQTEVPAWGGETFQGMSGQPDPDILMNGIEQLREMIARDCNHPSIFSWGLCNEIEGQNPPAYQFAKALLAESKRLDPHRLCSYASNSLLTTPANDASSLMDFVEFNEYFGTWAPGTLEDLERALNEIHRALPGKPLVISEYGYCACTPERPEGDAQRIETLRSHNTVYRKLDFIAGIIFFCYNDYRTHVGDRGSGALQQRIHGVVDLCGAPKPSYEVLRGESSPIESLHVTGNPPTFHVDILSRVQIPAYPLSGYKLRAICYASRNIPVERHEALLPDLAPGESTSRDFTFAEPSPLFVRFDVLRPTGFCAHSHLWQA